MSDFTADAQDAPADHPLLMSGRGVFYSFSFDLGPDVDPISVANTLLKRDMATIGGSPSRSGLRVGRRMRDVGRNQMQTTKYVEFLDIFNSGDLRWWRMFRLQPKITLLMLWAVRRILLRYLWHRILWGVRPASARDQENEGIETNLTEVDPESVEFWNDTTKIIEEASTGLIDYLNHRHVVGAFRLRMQQQMYLPRYYLVHEPFVRLALNDAFYTDQSHENEPIEISLMIHRSGVCILTFAMPIARSVGSQDAFQYMLASNRRLSAIELSVPILGASPRFMDEDYHYWRMAVNERDSLTWVTLRSPSDGRGKITVESTFLVYLDAVQRAAGRGIHGEWRCNTTLFQGTPLCGCEGAEAKSRHELEFAHMMMRADGPIPVTEEFRKDLLKNYLVNSDQELWLSAGHAIHTYWNYGDINYVRDTEVAEPIESAILQHRQLEAIDNRTVNISIRDRDLFAAQHQLATGLPEYGRNLMTDRNATEVVEGLAEIFRTTQLYSRLNDRVKVLESVVNTRFSRKQSARSLAISLIGLGVVLLLLLPRIGELLDKLTALSPTASLVAAFRDLVGGADRATVLIYIVAISVAVLILVKLSVSFPTRRRVLAWLRRPTLLGRRRNFGYLTHHDVVYTRGCVDEDGLSDDDYEQGSYAG
ncbi:Uncharacterised protein [Mycobacteroides abscessus subsp. abscessus]|nr:Uncharacterised protein [Mycobacteroides abscessus subsp. abscessus]